MKRHMIFLFLLFCVAVGTTWMSIAQDEPKLVKSCAIVYPKQALENKIEGKVTLELTIGKDGLVKQIRVLKTDNKIFNDAAIEAAWKYEFKPLLNECTIIIPFMFKLSN